MPIEEREAREKAPANAVFRNAINEGAHSPGLLSREELEPLDSKSPSPQPLNSYKA